MKYITLLVTLIFCAEISYAQNNQGDYVVILHGIARSSSHMEPLAKRLEQQGYDVININYPSTDHKLEELVDIIDNKISQQISNNKAVNFVGYSMGGILIRAILNKSKPANLGRVIQLAPPNHGSEVADFLKDNYLYKTIYGPAGQQLTTNNNDTTKLLGTVDYELGVIAGNSTIDPISSHIIDGDDDGKVSIASTMINGMTDHVVVAASHTFFPSNDDVHKQVIYFLENGTFSK